MLVLFINLAYLNALHLLVLLTSGDQVKEGPRDGLIGKFMQIVRACVQRVALSVGLVVDQLLS